MRKVISLLALIGGALLIWKVSKSGATPLPVTPVKPVGSTSGFIGVLYSYSTHAIDPSGADIQYQFDWNDGTVSETPLQPSGATVQGSHIWSNPGTYQVRVGIIHWPNVSDWSEVLTVNIEVNPTALYVVDFQSILRGYDSTLNQYIFDHRTVIGNETNETKTGWLEWSSNMLNTVRRDISVPAHDSIAIEIPIWINFDIISQLIINLDTSWGEHKYIIITKP